MKLSFMLLPLFVLRGIHTWLENHRLAVILPKEHMLCLHKVVGHLAMGGMLLHVASHVGTYYAAYTGGKAFVAAQAALLDADTEAYINQRVADGWRLQSLVSGRGILRARTHC